jgi:hypothetical protein
MHRLQKRGLTLTINAFMAGAKGHQYKGLGRSSLKNQGSSEYCLEEWVQLTVEPFEH